MALSQTPAVGTRERSDAFRSHESLRPLRAGRWVEPDACKALCHLIIDDRLPPRRRQHAQHPWASAEDTAVFSPKRRSEQPACRSRRPALESTLYSEHVAPFLRFEAPLPNMLYAIGGRNRQGALDTVEMLDTWHMTWVPCPPMPRLRERAAAVSLPDGRLLVAGGICIEGVLANCDVYDPFRECWEQDGAAPLLRARYDHGCAMLGRRIYAVGGICFQQNSPPLRPYTTPHCEVYDPAKDTWEASSPLQVPRAGCRVITIGGRYIAAVGGSGGRCEALTTIEVYCEQTCYWTVLDTKLQIPRLDAAVAAIDSRHILVAGGIGAAYSRGRWYKMLFSSAQSSLELHRLVLPSGGADEIDKEESKKHAAIIDMPRGRMRCQAAVLPLPCSTTQAPLVHRRCLLVVGGEQREMSTGPNPVLNELLLSSVATYDLDAGAWCEAGAVPNMAGERTAMALCQGLGRVAPARMKCFL